MYTKDKNHRITLRLNDDQFEFVRMNAETLDVSPSDFLRMVINTTMFSMNAIKQNPIVIDQLEDAKIDAAAYAIKQQRKDQEGIGRENDKANSNDLV